jgi:hypothetical protein
MNKLQTTDKDKKEITLSNSELALLQIKAILSDWADSKLSGQSFNEHKVKDEFESKDWDSGNLANVNPYHFEQALRQFNVTNHFGNNVESLASSIMQVVNVYGEWLEYDSDVDFCQLNPRYDSDSNGDAELKIRINHEL